MLGFQKFQLTPMLLVGLTNTVAAGGLGSLSSQTQEVTAGLSEIGMANLLRGDGKESVIFSSFFNTNPLQQ